MNTIIIYNSNTGFTRKYAEWLANALSCKAINVKNTRAIQLDEFDAVLFGGFLFAGSIKGFKEIKEIFFAFKGKKAVFVTGATPPNAPQVSKTLENCLTEEESKAARLFYLPGGLDYSKMGFSHKMMMKMMCSMMKKQHGADSEEYKTVSKSFDATDKQLIDPIVEYIKG